jgi:cytochrome o ubiquinol oxidase subunit III
MTDSLTVRHTPDPHADTSVPDPHQDTYSTTYLGFWMYLMTDCLVFATLFVTYAVLHDHTFGGKSSKELFDLSTAFAETLILLTSSVTCGVAVLSAVYHNAKRAIGWLLATFVLGAMFLSLEISEFKHLVDTGNSWSENAFLSSFFTLVGTHGLHITIGLLWLSVISAQLFFQGLTVYSFRRLVIFSLFWHFLDLIWIFIFTFVYLFGVL